MLLPLVVRAHSEIECLGYVHAGGAHVERGGADLAARLGVKQASTQRLVHHFLEGSPGCAGAFIEGHEQIVIQREGGAHPSRLACGHQGIKRLSKCSFTPGHSWARTEYMTVSRIESSCRRWYIRSTPSRVAPMRSIAA